MANIIKFKQNGINYTFQSSLSLRDVDDIAKRMMDEEPKKKDKPKKLSFGSRRNKKKQKG